MTRAPVPPRRWRGALALGLAFVLIPLVAHAQSFSLNLDTPGGGPIAAGATVAWCNSPR